VLPDFDTSVEIPVSGIVPAVAPPSPAVDVEEAPVEKRGMPSKRQLMIAGAGAGVLLLIVLLIVATRSTTGTLVVAVADPSGAAVKSVEVTVDGKTRCRQSPCTVADLKRGSHTVSASAAGYKQPSEQKTDVEAGARNQLGLVLVPEPPPAPVAKAPPAEPPPSPPPSPPTEEDQGSSSKSASHHTGSVSGPGTKSAAQGAHGAEPATPATKAPTGATGSGTLTVTSKPAAMVYVDGRGLGETPKQISLPAGSHTVTVVNADHGSKTNKITIEPGKSASVAVNF
jgi:hypothetical protein